MSGESSTKEKESEVQFQHIVEALPHLLWTCRPDGPCDYLSPQWVAYTGISEENQLGYGWLEQIHPADRDIASAQWAEAHAAKRVLDIEFRIRRFDGVYRWFKTRAVPELKAGRISKWFGTNTDIQDLKDAEQKAATLAEQLNVQVSRQTEELRAANKHLSTLTLQLQSAQRLTRVGSWEFHIPTGEVNWSLELFRVFGLDPQDTPPNYQEQSRMFDEESWRRLTAAIEHSVATGEGYELTLTAIRSDGVRRVAVARAEVLPSTNGAVETLVGTFQDVTDQQEAANRVSQLSERLQLATSAAHIGVWEWDLKTNELVWDQAMYEIYGISEESFTGAYEAWRSAVHPDDLEQAEELIGKAAQGIGEFRTVFRILRRDGSIRYIRAESSLYRDEEGQIARMIGVNWDITEQRNAELALRHSEALQSGILGAAGSAIIATTTDGLVSLFNPAAEKLLGYSAEQVVGKLTPQVFHLKEEAEARRIELEEEFGQPVAPFDALVAKSREGQPEAREWTYVRKDGTHLPVWLTVSTLRDGEDVVGYIGLASDLSSRKQHENDLRELNELLAERSVEAEAASHAKSMFVANMSHEIRTPIGAITGVTYLLARTELSSEQREFLDTIERSTRSLLSMVNDVLDLAKIEAGQLSLEVGRFSLKDVLVDIASLMSAYAGSKEIELVVDAQPDLPDGLVGDRVRLMQILTNLLGNAVKFTDSGGVKLSIELAAGGSKNYQCLRFEVQDTGPGMSPELMKRLFTPFAQGKQSGQHRPAGTGLGLAIVKDLIGLMHGEIGVESDLGVGSAFWFEVPFELDSQSPGDEANSGLRLLIVDDHEAQRLALGSCVRSLGWEVDAAASGMEALALIKLRAEEKPFDVIVVDWKMPDMDGLETLEAVHQSQLDGPLPSVVLTTAYDLEKLRKQPRVELADALVSKPITTSTLYDAVTKVIAARKGEVNVRLGSEPVRGSGRLVGARVLVADDSAVNRDIGRRILELEGALVVEAVDGHQAAELVLSSREKIDLVLMDVQMPIKDGVEATRIIRADGRFGDLPIIAVTAGALSTERERALAAGMTDYITKPYDPESIIARVRAHVTKRRRLSLAEVTRPRASVTTSPWPDIEGIDIADAKLRFGGDLELFSVLLERLRIELHEVTEAGLQWSDEQEAGSFLHKLRGSAGNLGARRLASLAGEAEQAIGQDGPNEVAAGLARLGEEMKRICAVPRLVPQRDPRLKAKNQADPVDAASLAHVLSLLQERSLEAAMVIEERSDAFETSLGPERYARFHEAISKLDYPTAYSLLAELNQRAHLVNSTSPAS